MWVRVKAVGTFALYILAISALGVTARAQEWWKLNGVVRWLVPLGGALVLVIAAALLHRVLNKLRDRAHGFVALLSAIVAVAGAVAAAVWFSVGGSSFWGFGGIVAAYFGVGQLVMCLRTWPDRPRWLGIAILATCAAAFVIGLIVLTLEAASWSLVLVVGAVLLAPVAINVLTDDAIRYRAWVHAGDGLRLPVAVGVGVLLAGLLGLSMAGATPRYLVIVAALLIVLVGMIASKTDADIVVVLLALGLVWAMAPRGEPLSKHPVTELNGRDATLVALGDSYISGEGARRFFDGTNVKDENQCRRAPTAYPVVVPEKALAGDEPVIPHRVAFLACSGAVTDDLYRTWQQPKEPRDEKLRRDRRFTLEGATAPITLRGQLAQLSRLPARVRSKVPLVLLSIGGNDADFGKIGQACVGPGDCSRLGGEWLEQLQQVDTKLTHAYDVVGQVVRRFAPNAKVLVVPYPVPLNPEGCSWSLLTANEHRFLVGFTQQLDALIERKASAAGFSYLADMRDVLQKQRLAICDRSAGRVGVNFLAANPVVGVFRQQVSPVNWIHNSLHPNERGHLAMAEVLRAWITTNMAPGATPPVEKAVTGTVASLSEVMNSPGYRNCSQPDAELATCRSGIGVWTKAQIARRLWYAAPPLLLVVVGAWLLWLQLVARRSKSDRRGALIS